MLPWKLFNTFKQALFRADSRIVAVEPELVVVEDEEISGAAGLVEGAFFEDEDFLDVEADEDLMTTAVDGPVADNATAEEDDDFPFPLPFPLLFFGEGTDGGRKTTLA